MNVNVQMYVDRSLQTLIIYRPDIKATDAGGFMNEFKGRRFFVSIVYTYMMKEGS